MKLQNDRTGADGLEQKSKSKRAEPSRFAEMV